jgi:5-formyltetrahydrofolate cyclo-ligase
MGIYEPVGEDYSPDKLINLIIVPGMAFDVNNNRLGRGKAFYDKFLSQTSACKIGVGFDFQLVDELPNTEKDIKMDEVIVK